MKNRQIGRHIGLMLSVLFFLLLLPHAVFAETEEITAQIPVTAVGGSCTAALYDADGEVVETLKIEKGKTESFTITCNRLDTYRFTVALTDKDTASMIYDKTEYHVSVIVYLDAEDVWHCTVVADPLGVIGEEGKPDKIEFVNEPEPCLSDPPVQKIIKGNPKKASRFTFAMTAKNRTDPMPPGSKDGRKEVVITGEGSEEFGIMAFSEVGRYEYTIVEVKGNAAGYKYDKTIYTLICDVTEDKDGNLHCTSTFLRDGKEAPGATAAVFTNTYDSNTPQTSDDSHLVLWISLFGAAFIGIIVVMIFLAKRNKKEKK